MEFEFNWPSSFGEMFENVDRRTTDRQRTEPLVYL